MQLLTGFVTIFYAFAYIENRFKKFGTNYLPNMELCAILCIIHKGVKYGKELFQ